MKISTKIYIGGHIGCLSKTCPFRSECANHATAGDFRVEDGFTPELFEENGQFYCRTKKETLNHNFPDFPANVEHLNKGALSFENGSFIFANLWED